MIRSFNPIGQGAFYVEDFEEFKMVYDCGSVTDIKILENEIQSCFLENESIDMVFISHLHEDHINGLEYLLKHNKVKRIFFPLIDNQCKKILLLNYYWRSKENGEKSFLEKLIENPENTIKDYSDDTKVILVKEQFDQKEIDKSIDLNNANVSLVSGTKIKINIENNVWIYIPHNYRETSRIQELIRKLKEVNIIIDELDSNRIGSKWKDDKVFRDNVIKAFKNIQGDLNTNSMVVYSGPENNEEAILIGEFCDRLKSVQYPCYSGCLYTGDYDANGIDKWKKLESKFKENWRYISICQLPHHGSMHNYNEKFLSLNAEFVISAGSNNNYHHPHAIVLRALLNKGAKVHITNEFVRSRIMYRIVLRNK